MNMMQRARLLMPAFNNQTKGTLFFKALIDSHLTLRQVKETTFQGSNCRALSGSASDEAAAHNQRKAKSKKRVVKPVDSAKYFESKWLKNSATGLDSTSQNESMAYDARRKNLDHLDHRHHNERLPEEFSQDSTTDRDFRLGIPLTRHGRTGRTAFYYTKKMSHLGKQGKIREAIAVYDDLMMKRDRVLPRKRTFITLIGILGRVGYTRKAFQLFRQMRMLGFDVDDHIYTSLFNACANAPSHEDGLVRAEKLIRHLQENNIRPNLYTVKSCMKALAVCGDFPRAFAVLDEAATRMQLDSECFNALLIACVSDRSAGFLRALLVWKKMIEMKIQPQTNTFNLFLRCVRDCGIGDPNTFHELLGLTTEDIEKLSLGSGLLSPVLEFPSSMASLPTGTSVGKSHNRQKSITPTGLNHESHKDNSKFSKDSFSTLEDHTSAETRSRQKPSLQEGSKSVLVGNEETNKRTVSNVSNVEIEGSEWWEAELPMDPSQKSETTCDKESLISSQSKSELSVVKTSQEETDMKSNSLYNKNTDVQTSVVKIQTLKKPEARLAAIGGASKFLDHMRDSGAPPDIRTFTQILSCISNDEKSEIDLLNAMKEMGTKPDVDFLNDIMMRRYHRKDYNSVLTVLKTMSENRLTPNMRTYAALAIICNTRDKANQLLQDMKNASLEPSVEVMSHLLKASYTNFAYKLDMLKAFETLGYNPTTRIITEIEKSIASAKGKIAEAERKNDKGSFYLSDTYTIPLRNFLNYYRQWLQSTELDRPEHPWKAFEPTEEKADELKVKAEKGL